MTTGFSASLQGVEEIGGPFDPFEIEGDDLGVGVLVEVHEHLGLIHVHPVAQGHEAADAQVFGRGHIQEGGAHGAGLRREGDPAPGGDQGPGGAHQFMGHVDPLTIGPDDPNPGLTNNLGQLVLEALPVGTGLGKAAGDDDGGLHPLLGALLQGGGDDPGRNHHHRQIRGRRGITDAFIDLEA